MEGSSEGEEAVESWRGVGFMTNLQWSGVTSPCVLRPWSKRNQENYLMRSCRGRERGHGVRSLGVGGRGAWRSEQEEAHGWESERNLGRARVRVQEGGPENWLVRREGGQQGAGKLVRCEDQGGDGSKEAGLKH